MAVKVSTVDTAPADEVYACEKDGVKYAGTHLLIDFRGGQNLCDIEAIETALRQAVAACGATLLDLRLHHFSSTGGVSGVAVLAESHMSIHTWPEFEYIALDIFMCGDCDPYKALPILRRLFAPTTVQICEQKRGYLG
jgi:S-adenosylmethionine decarboxylase